MRIECSRRVAEVGVAAMNVAHCRKVKHSVKNRSSRLLGRFQLVDADADI